MHVKVAALHYLEVALRLQRRDASAGRGTDRRSRPTNHGPRLAGFAAVFRYTPHEGCLWQPRELAEEAAMMIRNILVHAAAALLAVFLPWPALSADAPRLEMNVEYSATRIIEAGQERMEQRYYQRAAMVHRMETEMHGQQSIIIMRGDRDLLWTVMPQQRMVMEMRIDPNATDPMNVEIPDPDTWVMERLGRESVNGIPATKYRVATDEGAKTRMRGHMWISDHGIPVRTDLETGGDRILMELRDLVVGPQPAALFEPPADYQRHAIGAGFDGGAGGMLGGIGGMQGTPGGLGAGATGAPGADPGEGFAGELATEATEAAKDATKQEVRNTVRDSVSKGVRGLFGR
jgi:hypothetical protein